MKKSWVTVAAIAAAAFFGIAVIYGAFSDTLKVSNHIALGDVNIGVAEYAKKGGSEIAYKDPDIVVPGEQISKIPRIKNYGMSCWVRARVSYQNDNDGLEGIGDDQILGMEKTWVKRGEYYYYTQPLKRKGQVDLFQAVTFPENWSEEHSDQKLGITIQAEAIQAANFQPDFSAMSPWGNQEIQKCVHEQSGTVTCKEQDTKLSLTFNGKAKKLMSVPGDFFANMGTAMPGDTFTDTIYISNTDEEDVTLYFKTAVEDQDSAQTELLKGIPMTIELDGKQVYKGTLDSPGLEKEHSLGTYASGKSGTMRFTLSIPSTWDNAYALREAAVQWIFTVRQKEADTLKSGGDSEGTTETGSAIVQTGGTTAKSPVKTGDFSGVETVVVLLLGSGMVLLALGTYKRKRRKRL